MTTKLEDLFNLPDSDSFVEETSFTENAPTHERAIRADVRPASDMDKITKSLPHVTGLGELSDNELEELAKKSIAIYDDLVDLGMNVEARHSARIFEVASSMMKNAIDARVAKVNKKLKVVELQLRQAEIQQRTENAQAKLKALQQGSRLVQPANNESPAPSETIVSDRNSMLAKIKGLQPNNTKEEE